MIWNVVNPPENNRFVIITFESATNKELLTAPAFYQYNEHYRKLWWHWADGEPIIPAVKVVGWTDLPAPYREAAQ